MTKPDLENSPHIGTLAEKSLHAGLKLWYGREQDQFEIKVDGFVIDIVRDDLLIEIQTRHLGAMKRKLTRLLPHHPIQLIHPIAAQKWIVRQELDGTQISRRKSPKRGQIIHIFQELIRIPHLLSHPNLTITVALTHEEELWRNDGQGSWRRKHWSIHDRRLLNVVQEQSFTAVSDYLTPLPQNLPEPFTNKQLAQTLNCRPSLAQKITYTLRKIEMLDVVGKEGNTLLHQTVSRRQ